MTKWIVLVETNCADPAREGEFDGWYNQTHLPDMLETAGVVRAIRYGNVDPSDGQAKYLAAYEVEADDLQAVMQASNENLQKKAAEGRMSDLLQIVSIRSYKQLYAMPE